MAASE